MKRPDEIPRHDADEKSCHVDCSGVASRRAYLLRQPRVGKWTSFTLAAPTTNLSGVLRGASHGPPSLDEFHRILDLDPVGQRWEAIRPNGMDNHGLAVSNG